MQANTATAGTADAPSSAATLQYTPAPQKYTDQQVRQLEAALVNRSSRVRSNGGSRTRPRTDAAVK